ncbi:tetratricopeptide repeat protein [Sphingomonas sp. Leaf242]|uniref:tetratricopeptide repeat protein n=1 Tax=Sphingomonas sp. Leaf242 TaxID=1736304 RepID=UPI0007141D88|nr:tetratricopeptide repeat protein [Sphingomonas sp. Leaf242]KQO08110.1 hypothetical protein ASF09_09335 [Sphingomonas sp. Leaf242]
MTVNLFFDRSERLFDEDEFASELEQALEVENHYLALDYAIILKAFSQSEKLALRGIEVEALCFDEMGKHDLEIQAYDEALFRFGDSSDPFVHETVTRLLMNKAITLSSSEKVVDALAVYDQVIKRLKAEDSDPARERLARTLYNRAVNLKINGRVESATRELIALIADFEIYKPAFSTVAKSLRALAWIYVEREQYHKALDIYDQYMAYTNKHEGLDLEEVIPMKVNRATVLTHLDRADDALAEYEQILSDSEGAKSFNVARQIAYSLYNKASILVDQQRISEARGALQRLIRDFSDSSDSEASSSAKDGLRLLESINASESSAANKPKS